MRAGRKKQPLLTEKESEIMNMLWEHGPLFVRKMVDLYPDPKPHFNTVATTVRILEQKGYVDHKVFGGSHRFQAIADRSEFRSKSLTDVIRNYFGNSYKMAVSSLVKDEKISIEELREIIDLIQKENNSRNNGNADNQ